MLVWEMARTLPTVIVRTARRPITMFQSSFRNIRPMRKTLKSTTNPIFLEPEARKAEIEVGAPS